MIHVVRLALLIPALILCAALPASAKRQKKSDSEIHQQVQEIKEAWRS